MPVAQGNVGLAFGLVIAAGLSTTIGSAFVYCSSYANTKALAAALGVSAGVMLYVSFVEIFAIKAVEGFSAQYPDDGSKYATLCFFCGILFTICLDALVHQIGRWQRTRRRNEDGKEGDADPVCVCHADPSDILTGERALWSDAAAATHDDPGGKPGSPKGAAAGPCDDAADACEKSRERDVEAGGASGRSTPSSTSSGGTPLRRPNDEMHVPPEGEGMSRSGSWPGNSTAEIELLTAVKHGVTHNLDTPSKEHLKNMGAMTALAIALHNFPEGLATFVAALADAKLGFALAVAIAVHNIPEGVCVAMPVYYATGSKWKGFWWSFVSGISEPIGGIMGYLVLYGNAMSDTAYGALFGVVGGMMVYISLKELLPTALKYDPHDQHVTNCMFGGMAIMALSLILFQI